MIKYTCLQDIMKAFDPRTLTEIYNLVGMIHGGYLVTSRPDQPLNELIKSGMIEVLDKVKKHYEETLELPVSTKQISRLLDRLSSNCTFKELDTLANDLLNRVSDEIEPRTYFCIEPSKQILIQDKNLFGLEVTNAFPSIVVDIEEAGKCIAFERWTASVFHLMRVMEIALHVLGNALKLPPTTSRNWDAILKQYEAELAKPLKDRCPEWAADDAFFSGATTFLRSVKDAWRNPTMHVERTYTEEQAEDVWNAIKGFMRHLATKLKE